jgi:hypothetical protein
MYINHSVIERSMYIGDGIQVCLMTYRSGQQIVMLTTICW